MEIIQLNLIGISIEIGIRLYPHCSKNVSSEHDLYYRDRQIIIRARGYLQTTARNGEPNIIIRCNVKPEQFVRQQNGQTCINCTFNCNCYIVTFGKQYDFEYNVFLKI